MLNKSDMKKRPWLLVVTTPFYLHYAERETKVGEVISRHGSQNSALTALNRDLSRKLAVMHMDECKCPNARNINGTMQCAACGEEWKEPRHG